MSIKDRNFDPTNKSHRRYLTLSLPTVSTNDHYRFQTLDESLEVVSMVVHCGTVVGGTTVTVNLLKNGVSMLTAPLSVVGKQGVMLEASLATTRVGVDDILEWRFSNTGASSWGQVMVTTCVRPLVGEEVPR